MYTGCQGRWWAARPAPSLRRDTVSPFLLPIGVFIPHSKWHPRVWTLTPSWGFSSEQKVQLQWPWVWGKDSVPHRWSLLCGARSKGPLWLLGGSVTTLSNSRRFIGLTVKPLGERKVEMTHSLPAGNSEVIGETDSHKNTESRETVICAKKGVREEEMNFPWRDPGKHCRVSLSISSHLNN